MTTRMGPGHLTRREFGGSLAASMRAAAPARPNFVFILSDDHHFQCLGAAGNPHIRTPHLDRLAAEGVHFTNGIVSTPQCAPSRGVLLSGLETYQSGLRSNGRLSFRSDVGPTVVEQMSRGGYDTVLVGKWHIEPQPRQCGFGRAPLWFPGGGMRYTNPSLRRGLGAADEMVKGHITDLLTDAAIDSVGEIRQPFFLWLAYNAPHAPWHADPRHRKPYERMDPASIAPPTHQRGGKPFDWITYYSVITHLDEAIGRLVARLKSTNLWSNTIVIFLGDNGLMCGARNLGGKVVPWEESIRVPFLAAGGPVARGTSIDAPVASIDLPATWLDLAGIQRVRPLPGRSLGGFLSGRGEQRDAAFAVWDDGRAEALQPPRRVEPYRLVRTGRHKLIVRESGQRELYDWRADPGEQRNLLEDKRAVKELENLLRERMRATGDPALAWLR